MTTQFTPAELSILHISIERLAGTVSGMIAHLQREGSRELADLHQLGMEDIVRLRDLLSAKGAAFRPLAAPPNARNIGTASVASSLRALPADPLENLPQVIGDAEQAA